MTPLMTAALEGHEDIVKYLINHGANVNDKDMLGKFSNPCKKILKEIKTLKSCFANLLV